MIRLFGGGGGGLPPGVAGDGNTPGGLVVAGMASIGDELDVVGPLFLGNVTINPGGRIDMQVSDGDASNALYLRVIGTLGSPTFAVNKAGGVGVFGHAAPTVPATISQAVITAITDAAAKSAVQALADDLAASGFITIT